MGYRGKTIEQVRARELRRESWTLLEIADELGVAKSSVSLWVRDVDEARLRVRLYLHEGLDLDGANAFWCEVTEIPLSQFRRPYRAVPDASIRHAKHVAGCAAVGYSCSRTHRSVMGLVHGLLSSDCLPG